MKSSDTYIANGLRQGNKLTYESMFRDYYVILCAHAQRYVGRKDIAEEVVSETFFKLWKNRKKIEIRTSVKAYLFQAVANNSRHYLRQLKETNKVTEYFNDTDFNQIGFLETVELVHEKNLQFEKLVSTIEDAIEQLPPQQRKAFKLKRVDGKKNKEVAEEMGLSVKTVEMHLSKAMITIRKKLEDYKSIILLGLFIKNHLSSKHW